MIVVGAILALIGFGLLAGSAPGWSPMPRSAPTGYFQTGTVRLASATYAITSDRVDLQSEPGDADWLIDRGALGSVRLTVDPGRSGDTGLRRDRSDRGRGDLPRRCEPRRDPRLRAVPDRVLYRRVPGEATPAPPGDQSFWVAQVTADQASS